MVGISPYQRRFRTKYRGRAGTHFWVHWKRAKGLWRNPKKGQANLRKRAIVWLKISKENSWHKRCNTGQKGKMTFRKSLLQKEFLTQNRAKTHKRAICARLAEADRKSWEAAWFGGIYPEERVVISDFLIISKVTICKSYTFSTTWVLNCMKLITCGGNHYFTSKFKPNDPSKNQTKSMAEKYLIHKSELQRSTVIWRWRARFIINISTYYSAIGSQSMMKKAQKEQMASDLVKSAGLPVWSDI